MCYHDSTTSSANSIGFAYSLRLKVFSSFEVVSQSGVTTVDLGVDPAFLAGLLALLTCLCRCQAVRSEQEKTAAAIAAADSQRIQTVQLKKKLEVCGLLLLVALHQLPCDHGKHPAGSGCHWLAVCCNVIHVASVLS